MSEKTIQAWETPELLKARRELARLRDDPEMRKQYEQRLRSVQLWATELRESYQEGREEGREEGLERGFEHGRVETLVESIQMFYRARHCEMSPNLRSKLHQLSDVDRLQSVHRLLAEGASQEEIDSSISGVDT